MQVEEPVPSGGTISYQWYEKVGDEWKPINGEMDNTYTIPNDIQHGTHEFKCKVTNTEPGIRLYQCTDCQRILRTETIPALGFEIPGTVTEGSNPLSGVSVILWQGKKIENKIATTEDKGYYRCSDVSPGTYNVVGTKDDKTVTKLVVITVENATNQNLQMPSEAVNSILNVEVDTSSEGDAADVSKTIVGGLDDEAKLQKVQNATVTVTMTVEKKDEDGSDNAQSMIKTQAGSDKKLEFLEVKVTKEVKKEGTLEFEGEINETEKIIELVIHYNFSGKKDVTVYRHYGSGETALLQKDD